MTPEQAPHIRRLFEEALEIEPERRKQWLSERAEGALLREVEKLLAASESGTEFLKRVGASLATTDEPAQTSLLTGRRVGPYELLEPIGHGGMGTVYRATRADDAFRKDVAVKLLGFHNDAPEMELAFRLERQILASFEHPNIARLIDGGATAEGLLYIVMELVDGMPIDRYCEKNGLTLDARLALFESVCAAVEHAHRNLIVHRDLKPSNILVTAEGQVKLLDFGIAKVLGGGAGASPQDSQTVPRLTLLYASPEQIQLRPINTSTDIYSLGVVLYYLLTGGVHPYEGTSGSLSDTLAAICEREPPSPSLVSKCAFGRQLRGDLDNIVRKAMAKEPGSRYSSVGRLAEDVRRYRSGLPVLAHGDALGYRVGKFLRRHSALVVLASVLLLMIGVGILSTLYQARIANRQRILAERRAREAEAARMETEQHRSRAETEKVRAEAQSREADRMRVLAERRYTDVRSLAATILFGIYDSIRNLAGSAQARKLALDKSLAYLEVLEKESDGDPVLESELAGGYERAGELMGSAFDTRTEGGRAALPILEKALKLRRRAAAARPDDPDTVAALAMGYYGYANAQFSAGRTDEAIDNIEHGLAVARPLSGSARYARVKGTLQARLCAYYNLRPDVSKMLELCRDTVRDLTQLTQRYPGEREFAFILAATEGQLGNALRVQGRPQEGIPLLRAASGRMRGLIASDPNDIRPRSALAGIQAYLTAALGSVNDVATAADWADAVGGIEDALAADPSDSRTIMYLGYGLQKYSGALMREAREAEAERAYERALHIYRDAAAKPKAGALELNDYSDALSKCPFPKLANTAYALELAIKANQLTSSKNPAILETLAWAYYRHGDAGRAIETSRQALSLLPSTGGPETGLRKEISDSLAEFERAGARK